MKILTAFAILTVCAVCVAAQQPAETRSSLNETAVAVLDHCDRCSHILRDRLEVHALRQRPRDEGVPRGVELPSADVEPL